MPFVSCRKWPPPRRTTVLTRNGASLVFAAHDGRGRWFTVPQEHDLGGAPEAWFSKVVLKGMEEQFPPRIARKGQFLLGLDVGGTLSTTTGSLICRKPA